ncbi:acyltransferase [Providencia rettgeri]|nr:acyltransferase [Providencia rettgeri]ELR5284250.1 acyltransferase [Providencia rettgeri]
MEKVKIGNNVLIASRVFISDLSHGSYSENHHSLPNEIVSKRPLYSDPVIIEDNVWIGEGVIILPGVIVGENAIIGANSVITKNVEANCIYAGNPAIKIKEFDFLKRKWVSVK